MKDYPENLHIIRTALVKEGHVPSDHSVALPTDLVLLCLDYIKIDAKETDAEAFDALCKRLKEHFMGDNALTRP